MAGFCFCRPRAMNTPPRLLTTAASAEDLQRLSAAVQLIACGLLYIVSDELLLVVGQTVILCTAFFAVLSVVQRVALLTERRQVATGRQWRGDLGGGLAGRLIRMAQWQAAGAGGRRRPGGGGQQGRRGLFAHPEMRPRRPAWPAGGHVDVVVHDGVDGNNEEGGVGGAEDIPPPIADAELRRLPVHRVRLKGEVPEVPEAREAREAPAAGHASESDGDRQQRCVVCLESVQPGDTMRTLPCMHSFHARCIDPWLRQRASCPTCKAVVRVT